MGKGFNSEEIDKIEGDVLIAGHCAIKELYGKLSERLGKKHVYCTPKCNDLCTTTQAFCKLMGISALAFVDMPVLSAAKNLVLANLHGSQARVVNILSKYIKMA
jgi:hypothetical protein